MILFRHQPIVPSYTRDKPNRINLPKFYRFVITSFDAIGGFQKEKRVILKSPALSATLRSIYASLTLLLQTPDFQHHGIIFGQ
jgi:hypothetical protein